MAIDLQQIRILVVDDHPIFRRGITSLLADHSDMQLVAEASNHPNRLVLPFGLELIRFAA